MKFVSLFTIATLFTVGCAKNPSPADKLSDSRGVPYEIIKVDSCEYIHWFDNYAGYSAHKGDCKNPIHGYTGSRHVIIPNDIPDSK